MNSQPNNPSPLNENILHALRSQQRTGRALIAIALTFGMLAIVASIGIAWANLKLIAPMQRLLLQDYPGVTEQRLKAAEKSPMLPKDQLDWRHVQVTAAYGKAIFLSDISIALLAVGTVVILLLVIFNRRVTLRQINLNLTQYSQQISDLQRPK